MAIPQFTVGQVLTAAELNAMVDAINGSAMQVQTFKASGTFTVPAGVTYAVARIKAGGGGIGTAGTAGTGGTSSVAFVSGTQSAIGGLGCDVINPGSITNVRVLAGTANSGNGATFFSTLIDDASTTSGAGGTASGQNGAEIMYGAAVTAAGSITVTVGAGGTAGTNGAAGGTGLVTIEYYGA
jgi:hypothetical protein